MVVGFDASIVAELKATDKDMEAKGGLLTEEELTKYYHAFRARFGPDRLRATPFCGVIQCRWEISYSWDICQGHYLQ